MNQTRDLFCLAEVTHRESTAFFKNLTI